MFASVRRQNGRPFPAVISKSIVHRLAMAVLATRSARPVSSIQGLYGPAMYLFSTIFSSLPGSFLNGSEDAIDVGVITRYGTDTVRRIYIECADSGMNHLLRQAFATHGAFEVTARESAQFIFRFEVEEEARVRVAIASGDPPQNQYRESCMGRDTAHATLIAADLAVGKTSGLKGFFSGSMAFVSDRTGSREVYVADLFFRRVRQITNYGSTCLVPTLSPDGKDLLFTSYHGNGFPDTFHIDLNSRKLKLFAGFKGTNTGAKYGPLGNQVAIILSGSGNPELYVANQYGGNLRRLTRTAAMESDPSWSPDGRRLVFSSGEGGRPQLYTISHTGRDMRRLPTNYSRFCSEPAWNPLDPDLIAYTANIRGEFEIALYSMKSGVSRPLTSGYGDGDAVRPVWTNDGRHLIYTERRPNRRRLLILDSKTGRKTVISPARFGNAAEAHFVYPGGRP